jgi:hypothetical protein
MWLVGAGLAVCWVLRAGGLIWPAAAFSLWATVLTGAFLVAGSETGKALRAGGIVYTALKHGVLSGLVVLLGSLFVEFWPVTVSMACMFAICRGFRSAESPAYG